MYFATYNCSGFTDDKIDYINYLLSDIHVLFLQELWLIDNHRYKLIDVFKNCNVFSVSGVGTRWFKLTWTALWTLCNYLFF